MPVEKKYTLNLYGPKRQNTVIFTNIFRYDVLVQVNKSERPTQLHLLIFKMFHFQKELASQKIIKTYLQTEV